MCNLEGPVMSALTRPALVCLRGNVCGHLGRGLCRMSACLCAGPRARTGLRIPARPMLWRARALCVRVLVRACELLAPPGPGSTVCPRLCSPVCLTLCSHVWVCLPAGVCVWGC